MTAEPINAFEAISRLGPTQQVQTKLLEAINSGIYPPGSMLPSERVLCETFGVSRVSVREALAGLAATGLIDIQQGKGTFVRKRVADEYAGPFGLYIEAHRDELAELLQVRGALDGLAAAGAAQHADDEAREGIRAKHEAFARAVEEDASPQELTVLDIAFHQSIADAGQASLLPNLLRELNNLLVESRHIMFARSGQPKRSLADHEEILRYILDNEPQKAQRKATSHVEKMWSWVKTFESTKPIDYPNPADSNSQS